MPMSKFELGQLIMTTSVAEWAAEHSIDLLPYVTRHQSGDWGDVCREDANENELSLKQGFRLLSAYKVPINNDVETIWVITESDRSYTTILFPTDY